MSARVATALLGLALGAGPACGTTGPARDDPGSPAPGTGSPAPLPGAAASSPYSPADPRSAWISAPPGSLRDAVVTGLGPSSATPPPGARDVILVTVDTWRADRLGLYGSPRPTSEFLSEIASRGTTWDRAVSPSPWTWPSMASVAAGVPPGMHGAVQAEYSLCDAAETLAERFHAAGWTTGFAGSNTYLEPPDAGYAQGFEFYWARGSETAERVLDYARLFLDGAGKSPIFLHVHFFDPHCPYTPSAGAAAAVTARNFGPTGGPLSAHLPPIGPAVDDSRLCHVVPPIDFALPEKEQIARPRSGQRQDYLDAYDGELRDVDGAIATLAGILEERGRWDGAWIALTGDHGEEFAEHGRLGHGRHLYRESTWVPLLLRPPRDEAAPPVARVQVPVSLVDLTPTLAIAAGLSPSPSWTGRDLLGASGGPPPGEAEGLAGAIFAETNDEGRQRLLEWDGHRLVLDGSGSEAKEQLFDARADPMDLRDLLHESGGPPGAALLDKASRMRAELDRLEALHASRRICTPGTVAADPIREEQLRALGYAGGKPP